MDAYKILCLVGEGSFGRVFKAKRRDTKEVVALKIIRKCGRTQKELLSLRSECEIQKHLHHHNIIQMINSFETESEIVVVTEFCKRDLHYILAKQSYLSEEVALPIVCDLVSALFYLHSNRVLHRDLKPQNVLITEDGVAKLCDFGFARSMSRGTHVLTSIKGTPLYMAPELIEESPYDHNADLWSLGCIVYEMVVGMPPFTTSSILQLVRMIRSEPVVWPPYLSACCRSLLQGLLHKDPVHRLSWPTLLRHPFLQDRVSSSIASGVSLPLTKELTSSQALAKETQKQDLSTKIDHQNQTGLPEKIQQILDSEKKVLREGGCQTEAALDLDTLHRKLSQLQTHTAAAAPGDTERQPPETQSSDADSESAASVTDDDSARAVTPLETEEWLAFLQQSIREVMRGDVESMSERSFIAMVTAALSRHGATPKVTEYVASLLALPFITPGVTQSELKAITDVYEEVKVVSSLLYAVRLVTHRPGCSASYESSSDSSQLTAEQLLAVVRVLVLVCQLVHCRPVFLSQLCDVVCLLKLTPLSTGVYEEVKVVSSLLYAVRLVTHRPGCSASHESSSDSSQLTAEQLLAVERVLVLVCQLVHCRPVFLSQLCDVVCLLKLTPLLHSLLSLHRSQSRIALDLISILSHVLRECPENSSLVQQTLLPDSGSVVDWHRVVKHASQTLQKRVCLLLQLCACRCVATLQALWSPALSDYVHTLAYDSDQALRRTAEDTIEIIQELPFYDETRNSSDTSSVEET